MSGDNCCSSLRSFCSFCFVLVLIVVIVGTPIVFLFKPYIHPSEIKFYITSASLAQFNLTNNHLHYDLSVNITIRNPNKSAGIYYDYIDALAIYDDWGFGFAELPTFYQGHKNTTELFPVFRGQAVVIRDPTRSTYV